MDQIDVFKREQAEFWNGSMGKTWVETQEITDEMLSPAAEVLIEEAKAQAATSVLDIGCGNGTTTLAIARALGGTANVTGIDLSEHMISHAQRLSEEAGNIAQFIADDAAAHEYPARRYDLLVSRFGSMFFPDQIAALQHLRNAAATRGRLCFIVWRSPDVNEFLTSGAKAAAPLLAGVPERHPDAPSPFAMADQAKVTECLIEAGWTDVSFEKAEFTFGFPATHLETFMRKLAPLGPGMDQLDEKSQEAVFDTVRPVLFGYVNADRLEYEAACWVIRAAATA